VLRLFYKETEDLYVTGTLVWYYYICPREVWLMARNIVADQDDANIDFGRFLQENVYQREKKEVSIGHLKIDVIKKEQGRLVIGEVKKSSKYEKSAKMQLAFYLYELKRAGIEAVGELMFPQEKKRKRIELNEGLIQEIIITKRKILQLIYEKKPPEPQKINFCKKCAYAELCWA
jgi:CRISPR-associated exonuclease Cas4